MGVGDPSRRGQIRLRGRLRPVLDGGSVYLEHFALLHDRQFMRPVDKASALLGGYRRSSFSEKKPRSMVR